jgi:hypothetical protein
MRRKCGTGRCEKLTNGSRRMLSAAIVALFVAGPLAGCKRTRAEEEPTPKESPPDVRVDLSAHGLPSDFFRVDAQTKCAGQIIGYRFVVWLSNKDVAVGFNTSPNCRPTPHDKVNGSARILVFDVRGVLKAKRDLAYLADGNGEVVADGEGKAGPGGTLLFRIQSVNLDEEGRHESKSGLILLDANLKDVSRLDRFLEQTTFVNHALVFQEGFTLRGPRTYSVIDGAPPHEIERWQQDWPVGTMDRKFGDHRLAYVLCQQELRPKEYSSSNVIYAGVKWRCTVNETSKNGITWNAALRDGDTAAIVGLLADGSVVGKINARKNEAAHLVIWRKDQPAEALPWIPAPYEGSIESATVDMLRYATFATNDDVRCEEQGTHCTNDGHWMVFDRRLPTPIADRVFPKNGRAALSPDGMHYATFESGELRIYSLP